MKMINKTDKTEKTLIPVQYTHRESEWGYGSYVSYVSYFKGNENFKQENK